MSAEEKETDGKDLESGKKESSRKLGLQVGLHVNCSRLAGGKQLSGIGPALEEAVLDVAVVCTICNNRAGDLAKAYKW